MLHIPAIDLVGINADHTLNGRLNNDISILFLTAGMTMPALASMGIIRIMMIIILIGEVFAINNETKLFLILQAQISIPHLRF